MELLDEIELMTRNQQVSANAGLSQLSNIDSQFQISRADQSYHQAINANRPMRSLNPTISNSTLHEIEDLRKQREDSEAIINNLRKTIKDMARQMRVMEGSGSVTSVSPKNNLVSKEKLVDQMGSQYYQYELEQKNNEIEEIKQDHDSYTRSLKEKFKIKFNE